MNCTGTAQADSRDDEKNIALIDLSHVTDDGKEFYATLDGEWFFFPEMLLSPKEVYNYILRDISNTVQLPSSFKDQIGTVNTNAAYATRIKIPPEYVGKTLAIHIPFQYSAYKMYADRIEIASNGKVGSSKLSHESEIVPCLGYFVPTTDEILLTLQISSYDHIRGGFEKTSYIGDANIVGQKFNSNIIGSLFINGCIFIMGVFMIMFAWFRRQEKIFLIFGLFCMFFSLRSFYGYPFYYTLTLLDTSWLWGTRMEYVFTEASMLAFILYVSQTYKQYFSKRVLFVSSSILLLSMLITLFSQPVFFETLF